ncbi:MAG: D-serine ammonia-lyase [Peptococcaceae bacterium]|nr:D-serine ammonia-lyase [Peptococcaceae bacterium]MDH7524848.1 D-serine ammonia-lyase [Peptococcaceae bacterium]
MKTTAGKTSEQWYLKEIAAAREVFWLNPRLQKGISDRSLRLNARDVQDAERRLLRFAPYMAKAFPETKNAGGIIESSLVPVPKMQEEIERLYGQEIIGRLYVKCDSHLPVAGSIKARGGIYAVLKIAEDLAVNNKMLKKTDDYSVLDSDAFKRFFSLHTIVVGSTGNLGLSVGIAGARLGFKVIVHMSSEAKEWKKELLRTQGVVVVEHDADYTRAVEEGRKQSQKDPRSFFIDDENSPDLFLGYSVAAGRLARQLAELKITVDDEHPLFVYLPCGVGGGPGGVTFGLKLLFEDNVHCFFAEPTHSPAMLIGLLTGLHDAVSVYDFGLDNITEADGLAVARASGFVSKMMECMLSGVYTVEDSRLYLLLKTLADSERIFLEPSALAGFYGPARLFSSPAGREYLERHNLKGRMANAVHLAWATGGGMVPREVMDRFYEKGEGGNIRYQAK